MDLVTYISDLEVRKQLAASAGCSPDYLYQISTGFRRASVQLAKRIAECSPVTKESLRPDVWPAQETDAEQVELNGAQKVVGQ